MGIDMIPCVFGNSTGDKGDNRVEAPEQDKPIEEILASEKPGSDIDEDMIGRQSVNLYIEAFAFVVAEPLEVVVHDRQPAHHSPDQNGRPVIRRDRPSIPSVDRGDHFRGGQPLLQRNRKGFFVNDPGDVQSLLRIQRREM
jgi:hypothetical protein